MTDDELRDTVATLATAMQDLVVTVDRLLITTERLTSATTKHDRRLGEIVPVLNSYTEQLRILGELKPSHDERLTRIETAVERFITARGNNGSNGTGS